MDQSQLWLRHADRVQARPDAVTRRVGAARSASDYRNFTSWVLYFQIRTVKDREIISIKRGRRVSVLGLSIRLRDNRRTFKFIHRSLTSVVGTTTESRTGPVSIDGLHSQCATEQILPHGITLQTR